MSVNVDAKQETPRIFSAEDAITMKVEAELSDRQLFCRFEVYSSNVWKIIRPEGNEIRSSRQQNHV